MGCGQKINLIYNLFQTAKSLYLLGENTDGTSVGSAFLKCVRLQIQLEATFYFPPELSYYETRAFSQYSGYLQAYCAALKGKQKKDRSFQPG